MFMIRRGISQGVSIGEDVEVTVEAIENGLVLLRIKAPGNKKIIRIEEMHDKDCCKKNRSFQYISQLEKQVFSTTSRESENE